MGFDFQREFQLDWKKGFDIRLKDGCRVRVLSKPSAEFSYWVNSFVSAYCAYCDENDVSDSSYIGVVFGQPNPRATGMGSVRLRGDIENQLTVREILLRNDGEIAQVIGEVIGQDGGAFLRGHGDMVVMLRKPQ